MPGGYSTNCNMCKFYTEVQLVTLLYTILKEKAPLLYTFNLKKVSLSHAFITSLYRE